MAEYTKNIIERSSKGTSFSVGLETEVKAKLDLGMTANVPTKAGPEIGANAGLGVEVSATIPKLFEQTSSSSKDFQENVDFFTKHHGVMILKSSFCSVYSIKHMKYDHPPFSDGFKQIIKKYVL